jgi:hypothetical protein
MPFAPSCTAARALIAATMLLAFALRAVVPQGFMRRANVRL